MTSPGGGRHIIHDPTSQTYFGRAETGASQTGAQVMVLGDTHVDIE